MNIHSLTISGFKSFGKKTEFTFAKPITGIVGPNGSGKSNVTEALRFVLGEQSFKSMRTKEVTDLLFRGADMKASMLQVSLVFTDTESCVNNTDSVLVKNALEKNTVEVARLVYADGKNQYKLNGSEVRLKDIQETLLALGLSQKSSWHISQGESDKILLAGKEERKSLIEDALGLRIYHTRIDDARKKLEKSQQNIREVTLKRKEILPDIQNLERQLDKIEKAKSYRQQLLQDFSLYYTLKSQDIQSRKKILAEIPARATLESQKESLEKEMHLLEKQVYEAGAHDTHFLEVKKKEEETLKQVLLNKESSLRREADSLEQRLVYIGIEEGKVKEELSQVIADLGALAADTSDVIFKEKDIHTLSDKLLSIKTQIENSADAVFIKNAFYEAMGLLGDLIARGSLVSKDTVKEVSYLTSLKTRLSERLEKLIIEKSEATEKKATFTPELEKVTMQLTTVSANIDELHKNIIEFKFTKSESEKNTEKYKSEIKAVESALERRASLEGVLSGLETELDNDFYEIRKIFGGEVSTVEIVVLENVDVHTLYRNIEKLKLRIEETHVGNADEMLEQYTALKERDGFLVTEIRDLTDSIQNLETIIQDLTHKLKSDFENGVTHINTVFDSYVKKLFGGGSGKVMITEESKQKSAESEDGEVATDGVEEVKTGIDVEVDLPKKKVKGLHSLSGGERALVSIALTISIFNQNKVPFMVLDEADATLDEANAKRYGELLEMIKQDTKLIVVTHNRETMAFADEVYGVTLEKSGASKVLSVSFEDALDYAK